MSAAAEVYSLDEIASAAYVDRTAVEALVARGRLHLIPGTAFVGPADALAAARVLRHSALLGTAPQEGLLFATAAPASGPTWRPGLWSLAGHLAVVAMIAAAHRSPEPPGSSARLSGHLVFLVDPGAGGGGGGGGSRATLPQARRREAARIPRPDRPSTPPAQVAPTAAPEPEPLPSRRLLAPVAQAVAGTLRRDGAVEAAPDGLTSAGSGTNDGAGTGRDGGDGPGSGQGLGDGAGGGTGGHVYRPGSGIEPPRLVREIKGTYSEDARLAGVTGDVLMEVVVQSDGTVGPVRIIRGLGHGLDERAVAAVRQWRFAPARRSGVPVDVAVEVAMEFNLR